MLEIEAKNKFKLKDLLKLHKKLLIYFNSQFLKCYSGCLLSCVDSFSSINKQVKDFKLSLF